MRNFLWDCFQVTGSIDAYLLYKDIENLLAKMEEREEEEQTEEMNELHRV